MAETVQTRSFVAQTGQFQTPTSLVFRLTERGHSLANCMQINNIYLLFKFSLPLALREAGSAILPLSTPYSTVCMCLACIIPSCSANEQACLVTLIPVLLLIFLQCLVMVTLHLFCSPAISLHDFPLLTSRTISISMLVNIK